VRRGDADELAVDSRPGVRLGDPLAARLLRHAARELLQHLRDAHAPSSLRRLLRRRRPGAPPIRPLRLRASRDERRRVRMATDSIAALFVVAA
jgi:hypothetical protein